MTDDNRNSTFRMPPSSWLSLVRTHATYRKEEWSELFRSDIRDIVIVDSDDVARVVEEEGHAAVIIDCEAAAVVFVSTVELLISQGCHIPPLLLLTQSTRYLTEAEKLIYLSLGKMTPLELMLGERQGMSIPELMEICPEEVAYFLQCASLSIRERAGLD